MKLKHTTYIIPETIEMNKMPSLVSIDDMPPNMKAAITNYLQEKHNYFNFASFRYWLDLLTTNSLLTPEIKTEIAALLLSSTKDEQ